MDGLKDHVITDDVGRFWRERGMSKKRDDAVKDVTARFVAGLLPWDFKTVQSLIGAYPISHALDTVLPGQEDEATEDPEGHPWEDAASDPDPEGPDDDAAIDAM